MIARPVVSNKSGTVRLHPNNIDNVAAVFPNSISFVLIASVRDENYISEITNTVERFCNPIVGIFRALLFAESLKQNRIFLFHSIFLGCQFLECISKTDCLDVDNTAAMPVPQI